MLNGGRILEANSQLASLLGVEISALIGAEAEAWFKPADGLPLAAARERPAEAAILRADDEEMIVEIAAHGIEYRGKPCQVLAVRDLTARSAQSCRSNTVRRTTH